jgi:uncharacterized membrane protein
MEDPRPAKAAFFGAMALCAFQALRAYRALPPRVASHFGGSGAPNGWMSREAFLAFWAGVILVTAVSLLAGAYSAERAPESRINLPRKDYWLAPERRRQTLDAISSRMLWFGAATYVLLFDVMRQVLRFNLGLADRLEHPAASLAAYVGFSALWLVSFWRRFAPGDPAGR